MPISIQPATLKYKNSQGNFQSADCLKGDPGFSPVAAVTKTDNTATITVTDQTGTTSVNITAAETAPQVVPATQTEQNVDLDVTDVNGHVILRIQDGYIKTNKLDLTNPYEIPDYYKEHLAVKEARINSLRRKTGGDAFIFCTDQHMESNSRNSYKLIHSIYKNCRIDKLFMGGDLVNGAYGTFADQFRNAVDGKIHFMCGNHDYMGSVDEQAVSWVLGSGENNQISGDPMRKYYYVDNPFHHIRYIVTNSFKSNNGNWAWGFDDTQMTWITGTAMNVPTGWKCIIFSHMFWNSTSQSSAGLFLPGDGTGTYASGDMKAVLDAIDAANTNNQVACIVQGHTHQDAIKATTGGIPILIVTADRHNYGGESEPYMDVRVPGTWREQAFDVCIVDTTNNKIYAVRVGGYNTGTASQQAALEEAGERVITIPGGS